MTSRVACFFVMAVACRALSAQDVEELAVLNDSADLPTIGQSLSDEQVRSFARLALAGMDTEFPNKPSNVMANRDDVRSPQEMHPAFYGCFDWHSSVHGHWMLVRLLKLYPDSSVAGEIREKLSAHLTPEKLEIEAEYFRQPHNKSFERMYGWAWYFRLVTELDEWPDEQGRQWRQALVPLEKVLIERTLDYLPKLQFPIRTGVHPNTAFALGQVLDYARQVQHRDLAQLVEQRARDYFQDDRDYPSRYEPSGEDFFSAAWNEADLMRRVLSTDDFAEWLERFLPGLSRGESGRLLEPVDVSDVTDGKIVHLAGLDLSRAWCLRAIAAKLSPDDPRVELLQAAAEAHLAKGLGYVFSGHYEGEHWLATFAVYTLTEVSVPGP